MAPVSETTCPLCLKGEPDNEFSPGEVVPGYEPQPDPVTSEDRRALLCKACRSKITRLDLGMVVNGSHRHVFFNPQGLVFELGCFASAKNVIPTGPKTDEFTWFPGYVWQVVACTGCSSQLGWRYTGSQGGFFGLILSALIEETSGRG